MPEKKQEMLTVIVPTRNRADTLIHCLHTITSQKNPNMEIIVSDNFGGPEAKQVADSIDDKRLKYIRTSESMGMSEHWDFALEHVKGDWVTIIGDDDGLAPNAVDKFFTLSQKHPEIKAITSANSWFRWPSDRNRNGKLCIIGSKGYEIRDCLEYTKRTMLGEVVSQPTIYTGGFVHMDIVNEIKRRSPNGKFFQSINPDIYSGMAICSVTDKYIYTWEPWGIAGSSKHSNGRQHKNKTKDELKKLDFYAENNMGFHASLGKASDAGVGSMQIYLYESFLQSQHLRKDNMGITLADQLIISILHSGHRTKERVIEYCRNVAKMNGIEFEPILKASYKKKPGYKIQKLGRKIVRHIPGMSKLSRKVVTGRNLKNVYDAAEKIEKMLA